MGEVSARGYAADDFTLIRARKAEILADEEPKCPSNSARLLFDCLRSSSQCGDTCPYRGDWIGPQKD